MTVQMLTLAGKRFVILRERDFTRMQRALKELSDLDCADIALARKRLADPKEKPVPYDQVRKELGLA